jgi:hypothetical protein
MDDILKQQLGYITVSEQAMEDFWTRQDVFIPLEIEMQERYKTYKFLCASNAFDYLTEGCLIPAYNPVFNNKDGKLILISCNKVEL